MAPGQNINSTTINNGYSFISGTSQSTAFVSGAAAALKSAFPSLSMAEVTQILLDNARDLGAEGTDLVYGRGLVDLEAALQPSGTLSIPTAGTTYRTGRGHLPDPIEPAGIVWRRGPECAGIDAGPGCRSL